MFMSNSVGVPPSEVSKRSLRNGNGRLALVGLALAPSQSIGDFHLRDRRTTVLVEADAIAVARVPV